jgi:hypothetical protein
MYRSETIADHFDGVCSCSKLGESKEIDVWSVSEALIDDGLCTGRNVRWEGIKCGKTYFDLISLSPRTRFERI